MIKDSPEILNNNRCKIGGIISPRSSSVPLEKKLPSKPCNSDYSMIMDEARKNANVRYFFENNASQWNLI